jgi:hypothetical protein
MQLIQDLIEAGLSKVTPYSPDGDKTMRLHAQTATIENGFVHLPVEAHWLADFLHELTTYPNGHYDDQVDSTSQALAWMKQKPPGWNIIEFQRRQCLLVGVRPHPQWFGLRHRPARLMRPAETESNTWFKMAMYGFRKMT